MLVSLTPVIVSEIWSLCSLFFVCGGGGGGGGGGMV